MEAVNTKTNTNKTLVINWSISAVVYILITISLINESDSLMVIAFFLSAFYVLLTDISSSIMLLMGITIFENSFKISGNLAWFYLLSIILLKCLFQNGFHIKSRIKSGIYSTAILVIVSFITDAISYGIKGQMLTTIVLIIMCGTLFGIDTNKLNITGERIVAHLGISFLCAMTYVIIGYGGISYFISSFMQASYAYRFGYSYAETIGGAMAIPLYSLLIISFSIYSLVEEKNKSKISNAAMLSLSIISAAAGALTISRSFFMGLVFIIALFLVGRSKKERTGKKKLLLVVLIIIVGLIGINYFEDIINRTFFNLFSRISTDTTTGGSGERVQIWGSCFSYLFSNPVGWIIGFGSNGYPIIGLKQGLLFSAGAHNLFIDILMSWGIIGIVCVIAIVVQLRPQNGFINFTLNNTMAAMPLLSLILFSMTAMRSNSLKTVIYYFCCTYILYKSSNENYD